MLLDLLNYKTSILNPTYKILAPAMFLVSAYFLFHARNQYKGELGKVVNRLLFASIIGFLAMSLRYAGDYYQFWKWAESLGYVAMCAANVFAVWPLMTFVKK
jgi:hypothetical protein